jgi:hypothetical protein
MTSGYGQVYGPDGRIYIPVHSAPFAAGIFLAPHTDSIEQCAGLPPEVEFRHGICDDYTDLTRKPRRGLFGGWVYGNSMIDCNIRPRDLAIVQRWEFASVEHGKILLIEKQGDEEGMGAWSLKRLIIEKPRSSRLNEFGEEIDWEHPDVILRSHNRSISSRQLNPLGQYRIRGVLLRWLRRDRVRLVDSDLVLSWT